MYKKYKEVVKAILRYGTLQDCRNGKQLIIPHCSFTLDMSEGIDQTMFMRKMYLPGIIGEFNTLMSEEPLTNVKQFEANGCNYWKAWATDDGSINLDYYNMLKPQFDNLIRNIKADPTSRRLMIELWNYEHVQFTSAYRAGKSKYAGNLTKHPMYKRHSEELSRTTNPNHPDYNNYGGRGIKVSEEFKDFLTWLGHIEALPNYNKPGYTLDRIDNNKGYERGNLRWALFSMQNINQRLKGNNTSGFSGVTLDKNTGKYQARVMQDGKRKMLGYFDTAEAGAIARDKYILENNLNHKLSTLSSELEKSIEKPLSLECCWHGLTFSVINGMLHLKWTQRSVDTIIGLPSDINLAWLFMSAVADLCDLEVGTCMFALSNVHIYEEHINGARELLKRPASMYSEPYKFALKA